MNKYNKVKEWIVEAVPKKDASGLGEEFEYKLTLEDILIAMESQEGNIWYWAGKQIELLGLWQLGQPLSEQSKKVIDFLYELSE